MLLKFIIKFIHFIGIILFLVITNDYLQRIYPEKYKEYAIIISYNLIRVYSIFNFYYIKAFEFCNQHFCDSFENSKIKENISEIELVNNGIICNKLIINNNLEQINNNLIFVYSDLSKKSVKCINKKIYQKFPTTIKYEESLIQFMMVEIIYKENNYIIKLKDDNYNYYVVDNIFDKNFFMYYLKNHTNYNIDFDKEEKIIINVLDHNVDSFQMNLMENESIRITLDGYVLNKSDIYIME
jgi:hypothetical protein